jgi:hypothetical protein
MRKATILGFAGVLAVTTSAFALPETHNYCDEMCNLKYCTYTCCLITFDGGIATWIQCSSSGCCAHPKASAKDNATHFQQFILRAIRSSR